jgi:hypothetical protein
MPRRMRTAQLFAILEQHRFADDVCFLCGNSLTDKRHSLEHVVPRWAQKRFRLCDQKLGLLNGTSIPYRQLTIGCCRPCNNKALQPVETRMAEAVSQGANAVRALPQQQLYIWIAKLFFGLLYKELFLAFDRTDPLSVSITAPDLLREFRMMHFFLQSCRISMKFDGFFPGSIFVHNVKPTPKISAQWDLRDSARDLFVACRMGSVGIIAALNDGGAQRDGFGHVHEAYTSRALHPLQFAELAAVSCDAAMRFARIPKYMIVDQQPITVAQLPLRGLSKKPIFNRWNARNFIAVLSAFTLVPIDILHPRRGQIMTWLRDDEGQYPDIDFASHPWPPGAT